MNDTNSLVQSVSQAMDTTQTKASKVVPISETKDKPTEPGQNPKRREKQRLPDLGTLLAQPRQSKTFRLPVEICELMEKAKLWQRLDSRKPDNEQDIVAEAMLEWLRKRGFEKREYQS